MKKQIPNDAVLAGMEIGKRYTAEEIAQHHLTGERNIRVIMQRLVFLDRVSAEMAGGKYSYIRLDRRAEQRAETKPMAISREMRIAMDRVGADRLNMKRY